MVKTGGAVYRGLTRLNLEESEGSLTSSQAEAVVRVALNLNLASAVLEKCPDFYGRIKFKQDTIT